MELGTRKRGGVAFPYKIDEDVFAIQVNTEILSVCMVFIEAPTTQTIGLEKPRTTHVRFELHSIIDESEVTQLENPLPSGYYLPNILFLGQPDFNSAFVNDSALDILLLADPGLCGNKKND